VKGKARTVVECHPAAIEISFISPLRALSILFPSSCSVPRRMCTDTHPPSSSHLRQPPCQSQDSCLRCGGWAVQSCRGRYGGIIPRTLVQNSGGNAMWALTGLRVRVSPVSLVFLLHSLRGTPSRVVFLLERNGYDRLAASGGM
jgi:hypothetical protein